ncbi:putative GDP-fucose protein O-fucosyltransferase [Helianthus annuus]|uniref:O-fucosyltransferase family protein n=1 Tax=Helianthus annuus TaxID=4232 RepID=A0A251ULL4_HELAN|nr:O-fucosyltransferase 15 isoform X2 [Helianthus annuus]XP_022036865.1 O-fucosyltransferase 15-like isoform X2 [Helianthus annuus]XP_022036873.1 O-fucosyltransferase 15 isoform X2 [Helianthus annuus]KAF5804083.1 putative GDP-fucose protein O-fucosyltransferase [Helianthus annuus]KAF5804084.1 putative GDP-fucose protein O-fucosyltransferase [Helianthus annuus]KAF5804087.1 putative GDP-fucose protein O-fucosyltransferase [Helianthus annuus]
MQQPQPKMKKKVVTNRSRLTIGILLAFFILTNFWMLSRIQDSPPPPPSSSSLKLRFLKSNSSTLSLPDQLRKIAKGKKPHKTAYARLLYKAAHALAENQYKSTEPKDLWLEPYHAVASLWQPCADQRVWKPSEGNNGYILVTANGGINQQRVAVCNIVAVARLLNATLVIPTFMFSSVWRDTSQFADIYQEDFFIDYLKPDIRIVKELPKELQSLDLEAIGSVVTDVDIAKETRPSFYLKHILPLLMKNRVVHFVGFGNRLASDPIPYHLQRLRCRCNFHALQFTPKIQATAALLIQRMRQNATHSGILDENLVGPFAKSKGKIKKDFRYLALHLRFEIDMVAHSLCDFGGGEEEKKELQAYREIHFPGLVELNNSTKVPQPERLKAEGLCPLMPEETVLMLAGLGFKRETRMYLAGAHIYGGKSRLDALTTLFPNMVTKEDLLSPSEIEPFLNFSSQLAALDLITCTASDVFAMTDSGSQLSSLVSGYRVYYGGGKMPTIRPNKRRLADIFMKNDTIEWKVFETRIRKAVRQNKRVFSRPVGRSVYRYPRCSECMCNTQEAIRPPPR